MEESPENLQVIAADPAAAPQRIQASLKNKKTNTSHGTGTLLRQRHQASLKLQHVTCGCRSNWVTLLFPPFPTLTPLTSTWPLWLCPPLTFTTLQIVTDQQTGQSIQIVTAVKPSEAPKQQFILTTADSSGAGKVILASPDSHSTKQLIFAASDSIIPGRIQVMFPEYHCQSHGM